jgi:hypothetical protein
MNKEIIVWQCPECKDILCSNNWTRHNMNSCACGKTHCDFEQEYVRWGSNNVDKLKAKRYHLEELLK